MIANNPKSAPSVFHHAPIVLCVCVLVGSFYLLKKCPHSSNDQVSNYSKHIILNDGWAEPGQTPSGPYLQAFKESDGFFSDIHERDWLRMKERQKQNQFCQRGCRNEPAHKWYQNNFEPSFSCQHERRVGGMGDGPKWVCDPHRIRPDNCLIYSIGSNNDFRFEAHVHSEISERCEIHTFDPTVGAHPSRKPDYVNFHPWGVAATSGKTKMGEMFTVQDIMSKLGHQNRTIDIFKIDCEGCEWESYEGWFEGASIRQIQVELHYITKAEALMRHAYKNNFVIFHKEPNTLGCKGVCIEYAFLRLTEAFFK